LGHLAVHRRNREIVLAHLLSQPINLKKKKKQSDHEFGMAIDDMNNPYLATGVAKDDGLRDGQRIVQIAQRVEFPLLFFNRHKKLFDALESELISLDQNTNRVRHELGGNFQDLSNKSCRHQNNLSFGGKVAIDIIQLILESLAQQFIGFINDEHFDAFGFHSVALDHIVHTARRSRYNLILKKERRNGNNQTY
jgi:hypothetical protein